MAEGISILDVIKRGGYEASLITTFNAHLPFYEEVVLRKLVAAGCRHNVVLMDRTQCGIAWDSEATRPRLAGHSYTLLPIGVTGAFHPKVCILVGQKKASILVGSHNLTLSGFGYNREVTNWIEVAGGKDAEGAALLAVVWRRVAEWVELERGKAPDALLESVLALSNFINPLITKSVQPENAAILAQLPGKEPLLDQLAGMVSGRVKRIGVLGAFFDNDLALIKELNRRWPGAEVVVGIDPETVHLAGNPTKTVARFVDASSLWEKRSYLHAKVLYLDSGDQTSILASGSANPSRPAWMGTEDSCNVEAVFVRKGAEAVEAAAAIDMARLFTQPAMTDEAFKAISNRSKSAQVENDSSAVRLLLGTAEPDTGVIQISVSSIKLSADKAELLGSDMNSLMELPVVIDKNEQITLNTGRDIQSVRSCQLMKKGVVVARVMIHYPGIIAAHTQSTRQYQIRTALGALGSSEADISHVIAAVEKVIFSDETQQQVNLATQERKENQAGPSTASRPDTLAISVKDLPKEKRRQRFLKSGDLAYLLDVLMRRLGEGLESESLETDLSGRTEEEQVGQQDEQPVDDTPQDQKHVELSDTDIAHAVVRKARQLIRRMIKQLERASENEELHVSAILQLTAVLALLRELRHLEVTPRWRKTGCQLVDDDDQWELLEASIAFLFGSETHLLQRMEEVVGKSSDEAMQLRVLLLWLSWDLGAELTGKISRLMDPDELDAHLYDNALFLALMPPLTEDIKTWDELEKSILHTLRPNPKNMARVQNWMRKHWNYGSAWRMGYERGQSIELGGYALVPGVIDEPRVVVEVASGIVGLWDYDRPRQFKREKVVSVVAS